MSIRLSSTTAAARVVLLAAAIGCSGDATVAPDPATAPLTAVSPTSLHGEVGAPVEPLPTVRVTDAQGRPRPGVTVSFQAIAGSVAASRAVTGADGIATPEEWVLGSRTGRHTLTARSEGHVVSFTATAKAAAPASLRLEWRGEEVALPGEDAGQANAVVLDRFENGVRDIAVEFTVTEGSGRIAGAASRISTTDAFGVAYGGDWVLGPAPGNHSVQASVAGLEPASISVLVADYSRITWFARNASPADPVTYDYHDFGLVDLDPCRADSQTGHILERGSFSYYSGYDEETRHETFRRWGKYVVGPRVDGVAPVTVQWVPHDNGMGGWPDVSQGTLVRGTLAFPSHPWTWEGSAFSIAVRPACDSDEATGG